MIQPHNIEYKLYGYWILFLLNLISFFLILRVIEPAKRSQKIPTSYFLFIVLSSFFKCISGFELINSLIEFPETFWIIPFYVGCLIFSFLWFYSFYLKKSELGSVISGIALLGLAVVVAALALIFTIEDNILIITLITFMSEICWSVIKMVFTQEEFRLQKEIIVIEPVQPKKEEA